MVMMGSRSTGLHNSNAYLNPRSAAILNDISDESTTSYDPS
jgi:hypothetical protein